MNYLFLELIAYGAYRLKFGDYVRHELQLERIQTIARISSESLQNTDGGEAVIGASKREIMHP